MIPLLTIRREFRKRKRVTDHSFYLNLQHQTVEEWRTVYVLGSMTLVPHECRLAVTKPALDFVFNLRVMVDHPCVIMKNTDAIDWYAEAILNDTFL